MAPRVLVAIPAYREEKSIGPVVAAIKRKFPYDVLVVNDGSPDGTSAAAKRAGAIVLDLPCNLGIGGAVQTAFLFARESGYDALVRIDGDGQHEIDDIPPVLEPILSGDADASIGSRFLGETEYRVSLPRIFGIRFFRVLVNLITGYRVTDPTSGFFAINRRLIEFYSFHYPSDYPEVDAYILMHRIGARTMEVPVRMHARAEGKSSITTFGALYYMVKVTFSFLINAIRRFG
ncbi:MAG: glycosyltransferase family 2 protein [Deltaproteobacteria bacterium]|nr:glycosyltransferase family 2 protein [Deltaproteobacteria bacterium]PWB67823.1 MAG: glycosyl transferase family 2 [Deltaproteobacteria bacterium]